ncbi:hypothetical protein BH20VER2_BH20VER2_03960 [soil metagenome]
MSLDFNTILLFIALLSPVVVLARTWRRAAFNRGWQAVAVVVLLVTGLAWFLVPHIAGYVGGAAWLLLLFLPATVLRWAIELAATHRLTAARRAVGLLRLLHPVPALFEEHRLLRGLELAQRGNRTAALHALRHAARGPTRIARQSAAQTLRLERKWPELADWSRRHVAQVGVGTDVALLPLYFRALGEADRRDDLVLQFAGRARALLASPLTYPAFDMSLLLVLAFCGRTGPLRRLLQTRLRKLPPDMKEFWIATAEFAAGDRTSARTRLEHLHARTRDGFVRDDCAERLRHWATHQPAPLATPTQATIRRVEQDVELRPGSMFAAEPGRRTPVVLVLLGVNAAVFLVETRLGGSTNPYVLLRLGALDPGRVVHGGEYWRLFTALFLHYGALHLLLNSYPLFLLGRVLESTMGSLRFLLAYVLAGLGSSAGVVLLWKLQWTKADLLVGASGSVVGLVGVWAGLLVRHRTAPMAGRTLLVLLVIVIVQTGFDFYTPQISMAAHLCGLASGFVIGLIIAPKNLRR